MTRRIQRRRTKGWRMPEGAIYVGRPSRWGNPVSVGDRVVRPHPGAHYAPFWVTKTWGPGAYSWFDVSAVETLDQAVALFREYIEYNNDIDLAPLRGRDLACWCPEKCGEPVALYGVSDGDLYEPCAKPKGHEGAHDPSVPPWCHADYLLELAR